MADSLCEIVEEDYWIENHIKDAASASQSIRIERSGREEIVIRRRSVNLQGVKNGNTAMREIL